ncbi:MAG: radical SAM protein [Candidatus Zixiibacteriota bacterium]
MGSKGKKSKPEEKGKKQIFEPAYLKLKSQGELDKRIKALFKKLKSCDLCPRKCGVNRLEDEKGVCKTGSKAVVSSFGPHFGEESPLVGHSGSGTIFFTHCNLGCIFCQNYDISHQGNGNPVDEEYLVEVMLRLQNMGCHNINFVTPTHVIPQIVQVLSLAKQEGLNLPLVYNSGGYDSVETLKILDGIFDIYMPDFKYTDSQVAKRFSNAPDYPEVVKSALKEMHRQVGDLVINSRGIAQRGLLIRHLILPDDQAGTSEAMKFISEELSSNSYVNVMEQYRPEYKACEYPPLDRRITRNEFLNAIKIAKDNGIKRLDGIIYF